MIWWVAQHLFVTFLLVIIVALVSPVLRHHPVIRHALWLVVLLKFVTPAFVYWPAELRISESPAVARTVQSTAETSSAWAFVEPETKLDLASSPIDVSHEPNSGESRSAAAATSILRVLKAHSVSGLALVWMIGSFVVLLRWLKASTKTNRFLEHGISASRELQRSAEWAAEKLQTRLPKIVVADGIASPFVWCFGRAKIVWPSRWLDSSVDQKRLMLIHEMAHLRRRDHWTAWVEVLGSIVWWWNPAFWWARRNLRENAELACDMWVKRLMPQSCREYSETLIELGRKRPNMQLPLTFGAVSSPRSIFERRLMMIMSQNTPRTHQGLGVTVVVLFALLATPGLRLGSSRVYANPDDAKKVEKSESKKATTKNVRRSTNDAVVISEILNRVELSYFEDVDQKALVEAAIDAVVKKLDSDTEYLDGDRHRQFQESMNPNFVGIGARLDLDDQKRVTVVEPLPGSPAQKAGLLSGDQITVVNQTELDSFPVKHRLAETVKLIRGKPDTVANLIVARSGNSELIEIAITRGSLKLSSVTGFRPYKDGKPNFYCDEEQKIGYLHIRAFMNETADEVARVINMLEKEGARGIVLDLRFNGGGSLTEAVATANFFVDQGTILKVKKRNGEDDDTHVAEPARRISKLPMAVLVNAQTASAAEIVAACLQDHKRASIVGQRTFGMGRVKSLVGLSNGAALKLPIATVHRANGNSLHRESGMTDKDIWGVTPNEENTIELSQEESQLILEKITAPRTKKKKAVADRQLLRSIQIVQEKIES